MRDLHTLDKYRDKDFGYRIHGGSGDAGNGAFKVYVGGRSFFCIASNGGGWEHVSVSPATANGRHRPPGRKCARLSACFSGRMRRW